MRVPDPQLIDRLRLFTSPPGKKPNSLDLLTDIQLEEVFHLLKSTSKQWTFKNIAKHILANYSNIGDLEWIADLLGRLSDEVLGPRRGLLKMPGEVSVEEKRVRDRVRKREERAKNQLNDLLELGKAVLSIQDEIDFWTERGQQRGEPYERYVNELYRNLAHLSTTRLDLMIKAGLIRAPVQKFDATVHHTYECIAENVSDHKQFAGALSTWKRGLESIAEPIEVDKLMLPENTDEIQLLREDGQCGEGSLDADGCSCDEEPESSGDESN